MSKYTNLILFICCFFPILLSAQDIVNIEGDQDTITICPRTSVTLTAVGGDSLSWLPANLFTDNTLRTVSFEPTVSGYVYVNSRTENGPSRDSVYINLLNVFLNLNVQDTTYLCLGDSLQLNASISGDVAGLTWGPDDGTLSATTGTSVTSYADYGNQYYATYISQGCTLTNFFFIQVDSLPLMPITHVPFKDSYCPGDTIILFSPTYEGILYPDIEHEWQPQDGSLVSLPFNYNLTITATTTMFYTRTTTNGACVMRDSVEIIVKEPSIELNVTDTIVCPGRPVQLQILNDVTDISWSPPTGLSCDDCKNPVATVQNTTEYTVSGMNMECPVSENVIIRTFPIPQISVLVEPSDSIYIGDILNLTAFTIPPVPDNTVYTWVYNGNELNDTDAMITTSAELATNTVVLSFTTINGCPVSTTFTILAREPEYEVPNAFTPNSDEINDRFIVFTKGSVQVAEMIIVNRWGQVLYEANNNNGWDGTYKGKASPPEVYAYKVTFILPNGSRFIETGDLTLLR
jgi:gliding motility-associated-like protein